MANVTDLNDTLVTLDIHGDSSKSAMKKFNVLCNLAHKIETDPCCISYDTDASNLEIIHAEFNFSCAAEKIIFQLNYQFNSKYKIYMVINSGSYSL